MLTRCPHCQTAFRVTSEQLKLRQGKVRCGECLAVFNALESLADEVTVASVAAAPASSPEVALPTDELRGEAEPSAAPAAAETARDDVPATAEPQTEMPPEPVEAFPEDAEESRRWSDGAPATAEEPTAPDEPAAPPVPADELAHEATAELPEAWEAEEDVSPPPRRWPWVVGSLLLLLLAAAQLLYIYRVELAVQSPVLRPLLADACAALGCTLPRPRKPELVGIESSDLAPEGGERLLLTASLRNRAPFAQDYPHLELTLTDTRDSAILRKVLPPADYLAADQSEAAGFAPQGEVAVKLLLEARGVPAVGYRLYLFYP